MACLLPMACLMASKSLLVCVCVRACVSVCLPVFVYLFLHVCDCEAEVLHRGPCSQVFATMNAAQLNISVKAFTLAWLLLFEWLTITNGGAD